MAHFYLAGPMRGHAEFNFPAFRTISRDLRNAGLTITSPHELDEASGYFWEGFTGHEDLSSYNFDLTERLTEDIHVIGKADGVIVMQGWQSSSGARAEASFALAVGKPVYYYTEPQRYNGFQHELFPVTWDKVMDRFDVDDSKAIEWEEGYPCPL